MAEGVEARLAAADEGAAAEAEADRQALLDEQGDDANDASKGRADPQAHRANRGMHSGPESHVMRPLEIRPVTADEFPAFVAAEHVPFGVELKPDEELKPCRSVTELERPSPPSTTAASSAPPAPGS